jgi:hypothetical protein
VKSVIVQHLIANDALNQREWYFDRCQWSASINVLASRTCNVSSNGTAVTVPYNYRLITQTAYGTKFIQTLTTAIFFFLYRDHQILAVMLPLETQPPLSII